MKADRVVVDTSILISAAHSAAGKPAAVVDHIVAHGALVFSRATFEELATRIGREKFDRYLRPADRIRYLEKVSAIAVWVEPPGTLAVCRDPSDDMVLEVALEARADCLVSGDQDLLVLNPFRGIPVVTAAVFYEKVVSARRATGA